MTQKEEKIVEFLRAGKSYTEIQILLEVSPSKISQIKKEYFPTETDEETTFDTAPFYNDSTTDSDSSSDRGSGRSSDRSSNSSNAGSNIGEKSISNLNKNTPMDNKNLPNPELHYPDRIALEKLKIELAHEAEMKKLEYASVEQELRLREQTLKERRANSDEEFLKAKIVAEISSKEKNTFAASPSFEDKKAEEEQKKVERQGKLLLFKFKKLVAGLQDGEWAKWELNDILDKTIKLKEDVEVFCIKYDFDTEGLRVLDILIDIEEYLDEDLSKDNHNDSHLFNVNFDELSDIIEEAKDIEI